MLRVVGSTPPILLLHRSLNRLSLEFISTLAGEYDHDLTAAMIGGWVSLAGRDGADGALSVLGLSASMRLPYETVRRRRRYRSSEAIARSIIPFRCIGFRADLFRRPCQGAPNQSLAVDEAPVP